MAGVQTSTSAATQPAATVGRRDQLLGHHALQRGAQLDTDLVLLVGREHVDDPVDGGRGVLGVQGGEDEVASLGRGQGGGDGLEVAELTDQDDVGVLAQDPAERLGERIGVRAHLALADDRALVAVQELDRVLDGDDVQRFGSG